MELQRLYVTLALDASDFKAGMATVTGIVAAGAIAASAAVAAVAIDGVKAAIDMEEQMSGIAAIFSTTVDQIQPLGPQSKPESKRNRSCRRYRNAWQERPNYGGNLRGGR
jgi:hypothetical protein